MTLEASLRKAKGVESIMVDFKTKKATIEFDESVISAGEVASALSDTPHMMGSDMKYAGTLVLRVAGLKDDAVGKKAKETLSKIEGIAAVTPYPQQEIVAVQFSGKRKVTTKQLIEALERAGLRGSL